MSVLRRGTAEQLFEPVLLEILGSQGVLYGGGKVTMERSQAISRWSRCGVPKGMLFWGLLMDVRGILERSGDHQ